MEGIEYTNKIKIEDEAPFLMNVASKGLLRPRELPVRVSEHHRPEFWCCESAALLESVVAPCEGTSKS